MLTGRAPQSTEFTYDNDVFRDKLASSNSRYESFPHLLRDNGYTTALIGKISHHPGGEIREYDGSGEGSPEMPQSWDSIWAPTAEWGSGWDGFFGYAGGDSRSSLGKPNSAPFEAADGDDLTYRTVTLQTKPSNNFGFWQANQNRFYWQSDFTSLTCHEAFTL